MLCGSGRVIKKADLIQEGVKHDHGKIRYELVSACAIEQLALVLTHGADRYGDRNWERGIAYGRVFGAILRHLWSWWAGQTVDPDSGLHPLAHAMCDVMMLLHYESNRQKYSRYDDRGGKEKE